MELPGWGKMFKWFGVASGDNDKTWQQAPTTQTLGKWHHYKMKLDLSDWCDRHTYFLGRYYELSTQLVLKAVLNPGDRFVDIGANHGMISLLGAYLVGAKGTVESFEPNPSCVQRIKEHIQINNVNHIQIHPCAIGATPSTLELSILTLHTGYGTLGSIPDKDKHLITQVIDVPVHTADSVLNQKSQAPSLIKIDVEGFELNALLGLEKTLSQSQSPVITEVVDNYLKRADHTRKMLMDYMHKLGYKGYQITTQRHWIKHRLHLIPMPSDPNDRLLSNDILWLNPQHHQTQSLIKSFG